MESVKQETISILNDLIRTIQDGEEAFRLAVVTKRGDLKILFSIYSLQCRRFMNELQAQIQLLGGEPVHSGVPAAPFRRRWMDVRNAISIDDEDAINAECERGEDAAVRKYREALNKELTGDVRALISRQYTMIRETRSQLHALR